MVSGGRSLEQPIDAEDVTEAILRSLSLPGGDHETFELAGPESLPRRELLARAAALVGSQPRVIALPSRETAPFRSKSFWLTSSSRQGSRW